MKKHLGYFYHSFLRQKMPRLRLKLINFQVNNHHDLRKISSALCKQTLSLIFLGLFSQLLLAKQSIHIYASLPQDSAPAEFLFIIEDIDQGIKKPTQMSLHAGKNMQAFEVDGDHYRIIPVKLTSSTQSFTPCEPTAMIDHHALIITLHGALTANQLHCDYRQTNTLIDLNSNNPKKSSTPTTSITTQSHTAYFRYLHQLSQCAPGEFQEDFNNTQPVSYSIVGMKEGLCNVKINTYQSKKPLLCRFTTEDIALLTSPARMDEASQGKVSSSLNDLSARIMKQRCH